MARRSSRPSWVHGGPPASIEPAHSYFTRWPDTHLTPYSEIAAVPPGKYLIIRQHRTVTRSYWNFGRQLKIRYQDDRQYEEHFLFLLRQSVGCRLRTESPLLAHLSGGLDSSAIVCVADEILRQQGAPSTSLQTFSFYDPDEPGEEDYSYFSKLEEQRGQGYHAQLKTVGDTFSLDYTRFTATPGFGVREELKAAEAEVIKNGGYRVILSGFGGDQVLGQTMESCAYMADLLIQLQFGRFFTELVAWSLRSRRPLVHLLARILGLLFPIRLRALLTRRRNMQPWLDTQFARTFRIIARLLPASEGRWFWLPSTRTFFQAIRECAGYMSALEPSIGEVRYPLLDQRLVEFLVSIPRDQLLRSGERRCLMRRALANLVPPEILSRHTKSSTGRCDILTLRKHWRTIESVLAAPITGRLGLLDRTRFRDSLVAFAAGRTPAYDGQLLRGVSLEFWLRDMTERGIISVPTLEGAN